MADHLTFALGRDGFNAYKYVPYGPVDEVMPYLIRRAQENGDLLGGVGHERALLRDEVSSVLVGAIERNRDRDRERAEGPESGGGRAGPNGSDVLRSGDGASYARQVWRVT
jgi:hypothetical protein